RIGPGFGNGAQFQVPCNIELGKTYFVTVHALGKNGYPGGFSEFKSFVWTWPNPPLGPQVPWPALGPPTTNANFTVQASYLAPTNPPGSLQWNAPSGVGVLVGFADVGPGNPGGNPIHIQIPPTITVAYDPNSALKTN